MVSWKPDEKYDLYCAHTLFLWFDIVTYFLTGCDWVSNLTETSSRQRFWHSFMKTGWKLWLLMCSQAFSLIWPSDLVFGHVWPSFKLDRDIINTKVLTKFYGCCLTCFKLDRDIKTIVLTEFHEDPTIMWPLMCSHAFSMIWPSDLVFGHAWLSFKLGPGIIKTKVLTKFHEDLIKNVASNVFTSFFYDCTKWSSFLAGCDQVSNLTKISRQRYWQSFMKIGWKMWPLMYSQAFSMTT